MKKTVKKVEGERLRFFCEGCQENHVVNVKAGGWKWNGDFEKPTITPSIRVMGYNLKQKEFLCHSFITDGSIRYLNDCTHKLKGKTVTLKPIEDYEESS